MENLSVLTDFPEPVFAAYYHKLETAGLPANYSLCSGGTYYFLSNDRGRTIRFTESNLQPVQVTSPTVEGWLRKIHTIYPNF
jgi:hypothetical protein